MSRARLRDFFRPLCYIARHTIRYTSSAFIVYFQIYYPLIYTTEIAATWRQEHKSQLRALGLTALVFGLQLHRTIKLFFPWTQIWYSKSRKHRNEQQEIETEKNGISWSENAMSPEQPNSIDLDSGLTEAEASMRRGQYGHNIIWSGSSWMATYLQLMSRADNSLSEVAILTAWSRQDWLISLALLAPFTLNNAVELYQLKQSDDVAKSLSWSSTKAVVVREGNIVEIRAVDLVPGDVVHISPGQTVPADIQVTRLSGDLRIDQSSITGDNTPSSKVEGEMCYGSTGVLTGSAFGVVSATGHETFVGRTVSLAKGAKAGNDRDLDGIMSSMGLLLWGLASAVTLYLITSGLVTSTDDIVKIFVCWTMISTYAGSRGSIISKRAITAAAMSKEGAVVRSIVDVETMTAIDLLCADVTGTFTETELVLQDPVCIGCDADELILTACLTTPWEGPSADPIDYALLNSLHNYPQAQYELVRYRRLDYGLFDPNASRTWAEVMNPQGAHITCIKGAPKVCVELWQENNPGHPQKDNIVKLVKEAAMSVASKGVHALVVLRQFEHGNMELLGLLPFVNEIRWNAATSMQTAHELGIGVRLLTASYEGAANVTMTELGLGGSVLSIPEFFDATKMKGSSTIQHRAFEEVICFCEASSESKTRIVTILHQHGHVVACTGDGLSDVPSLRTADYGIAVDGSSEAAQKAANLVMLRPGIDAIVSTIAAARRHFRWVETYLTHRAITCTVLVLVVFLYYRRLGLVMPAGYMYLIMCGNDVTQLIFMTSPVDGAPTEKKPSRLIPGKLWGVVLPLSITLAVIVVVVLELCPSNDRQTTHCALYCCLVLSCHWIFQLVYTGWHPWKYGGLRFGQLIVLALDAILLLVCIFAWPEDGIQRMLTAPKNGIMAVASVLSTLWQLFMIWQDT